MNADWTEETCTGTGDDITLTGATAGNLPFIKQFNDGDLVKYAIEDSAGVLRVNGIGVYSSGVISRADSWNYDGVSANDNPASNITLSAGTHTVRCAMRASDADNIDNINTGALGITPATISAGSTLTADSAGFQVVASGTAGDVTVTLPDATTISNSGLLYLFENNGDGDLYIKNGSGTVIVRVSSGKSIGLNLKGNSSTAGLWSSFGFNSGTQEAAAGITVQGSDVFESAITYFTVIVALSATKALAIYKDGGNGNSGTAVVLDVTAGGVITAGTPVVYAAVNTSDPQLVALSATQAVAIYKDGSNSSFNTAVVLDISGTTVTAGSPVVFESSNSGYNSASLMSAGKLIVGYTDNGNNNYCTACVLTVSGSVVTAGAPVVVASKLAYDLSIVGLSATQAIMTYADSASQDTPTAVVLDVAGTVITPASAVAITAATYGYEQESIMLTATKALVVYRDGGAGSEGHAVILDVAGSVITPGAVLQFTASYANLTALDSFTATKAIVAYRDDANLDYGTVCVLHITGSTLTADTPVVFKASAIDYTGIAALSESNAITCYQDEGNGNYGTATAMGLESWVAF